MRDDEISIAERARRANQPGRYGSAGPTPKRKPAPPIAPPGAGESLRRLLVPAIRRPGVKHLHMFCVGLRSCVIAGTPILTALELMARTAQRESLRRACLDVARDVSGGRSLEEAMRKRRRVFSPFFTNMFLAGLESGALPQALDQLIEHYAWVLELRSNILRVIWYPIFLLFAGSLIMAAPPIVLHLRQNPGDWRGAIPIGLSFFALAFGGMIAAYVASRIVKSPAVRPATDEVVARIPGLGKMFRKYALATFFRAFAAAVVAGRELGTGFRAALDSMDNHNVARRLRPAERFLRGGDTVTYALSRTRLLDARALGMVEAGEISGSLPELAGKMADYYMTEVKALLPGLIKALFPFCLVTVAVAYFVEPNVLFGGSFALFFLLFLTI